MAAVAGVAAVAGRVAFGDRSMLGARSRVVREVDAMGANILVDGECSAGTKVQTWVSSLQRVGSLHLAEASRPSQARGPRTGTGRGMWLALWADRGRVPWQV